MSLASALAGLKKCFSDNKDGVNTSNVVFKLHRLTGTFLLCCSALTSLRQYFGNNIDCMHGYDGVTKDVFESYCFMRGTYTYTHDSNRSSYAHHGVSAGQHGGGGSEKDAIQHSYYQWVGLLLVLQACLCFLPWSWWKSVERGRLARLVEKISKDPLTEVPVEEQVAGISKFIINNSKWFDKCAVKLMLGQLMCLVLTITQLYLIDLVLNNQFLQLGRSIMDWYELDIALETVFPLVVKCSMNYFGASGEVVNVSGMCTLPINILNEKIYLIIWVMYLIMIIITVLSLIGQIMVLITPYLRQLNIHRDCKNLGASQVKRLIKRISYGDYMLLRILANNIDTTQFSSLLANLCDTEQMMINSNSPHSVHHLDPSVLEQYASPEKFIKAPPEKLIGSRINNNHRQNRMLYKDL